MKTIKAGVYKGRYTDTREPLGRFIMKITLYGVFAVFFVLDFIILSDLLVSSFGGTPFIFFMVTAAFIIVISAGPIFIIMPTLSKVLKKTISPSINKNNYRVYVGISRICGMLFLIGAVFYFFLRTSYENTLSLETVIMGILPIVTTAVSCLFNLYFEYTSDVDRKALVNNWDIQILECKEEIEKLCYAQRLLTQISYSLDEIKTRIDEYEHGIAARKKEACDEEQRRFNQNNEKLKGKIEQLILSERHNGDKMFDECQMKRTPKYVAWTAAMDRIDADIHKNIDLRNPQLVMYTSNLPAVFNV